jgi:predicted nucleic acid-binding protein
LGETSAEVGVTREQTELLASKLAAVATVLLHVPDVFMYERDPDDAHYVNAAITANARLIVSRDRDLLDLMDPARPEGQTFQTRFPALRIIDPVALLRELEAR